MPKIIYWNVWCLPGFATDGTSPYDRAKSISPLLNGYDIAILNEAWTDDAKEVFKQQYPYHYQTKKKCTKLLDSGLLILSKYPIVNPSYILYSEASNWDWFASKGAIHFEVNINGKAYRFFTTHMQAGDTYKDQCTRLSQFTDLVKFVNSNVKPNDNVYLIGDFNVMALINGTVSGHCTNLEDAIMRSAFYELIKDQTGFKDIQTGSGLRDVYHFFTNQTSTVHTLTYHDSKGLSDGAYLTLDF